MDLMRLGEEIRRRRKAMGLTQTELAGEDFTKSFVSQIEKGKAAPSLDSLERMARRLNILLSSLIGRVEQNSTHDLYIELEKILEANSTSIRGDIATVLAELHRLWGDSDGQRRCLRAAARYYQEAAAELWRQGRDGEAADVLEKACQLLSAIHGADTGSVDNEEDTGNQNDSST